MKLNELKYTEGSRKQRTRCGRGIGSGLGKNSGRGMNGQKKRTSPGIAIGFEGGQLPLSRRLPKFGFTNFSRKVYAIVNVEDLNKFDADAIINPTVLIEAGLVKKEYCGVKILGNGKLNKKLTVSANKFSASAKKAIEEAGGKVEVIA